MTRAFAEGQRQEAETESAPEGGVDLRTLALRRPRAQRRMARLAESADAAAPTPEVCQEVEEANDGGVAPDAKVRKQVEDALGVTLRAARVHLGPASHRLAESQGAPAVAVG